MENFEFQRAGSVEAAQASVREASDGKFLAGGQSLIPLLKLGMASPDRVVSITGIAELSGIERSGDAVVIGAGATHAEVASSDVVREAIPALGALAAAIGDPQVRNRGTLGGSVAHADPAADYPAALVALGATVVTDRREMPAEEFFVDMFDTPLESDELITTVRFPVPEQVKFPNPASKYAIAGVMVARSNGSVRVAVTGVAGSVFRATQMEQALADDFSVAALDGVGVGDVDALSDVEASAEYRLHLAGVMARRAVEACG
jgi:carbon-monoxide dehydrogenase medium subunit